MVVELAAVRLIAPWFGTSQTVWTNVIGVVLLALAVGYLAGARLSRRERPERALGWVLAAAASTAAWLPALAPRVAGTFLPEGLALDEVAGLLRWGSLATALVLFLPPALFLGCVSPICAEIVERARGAGAGSAGGRVLCASTLGSLVGTFSTSYWLVPVAGLTKTFLAAGVVLALLAAFVLIASKRSIGAGAGVLLVAAAFAPGEMPRPAPKDGVVVAARESPYQSVRVVRRPATDGGRERRELQVNEAFDSFQSVWVPGLGLIGDGSYYDVFALPAWWSERREGTWRLCVLGLGAGSTFRVVEGTLPRGMELDAIGVEIDPVVVELGREWMELAPGPKRRVLAGWDARTALAHLLDERFDQIVVDAYANQMEIPPHLCTREFFELVRERLVPSGVVCVNVGAFSLADPVLDGVGGALAAGMRARAVALRVPFSRNVVLVSRRDGMLPGTTDPAFVPAESPVATLADQLALPGAQRAFLPERDAVLTDDRCDVELRQLASIARARDALEAPRER